MYVYGTNFMHASILNYKHVTFQNFERCVVCQNAWRHSGHIEFNSSEKDYVCFKLKIVGREDAQTMSKLLICCASFVGEVLKALCRSSPPHLFLYLFIQTKRNKVE